jgi:hypothetical protein
MMPASTVWRSYSNKTRRAYVCLLVCNPIQRIAYENNSSQNLSAFWRYKLSAVTAPCISSKIEADQFSLLTSLYLLLPLALEDFHLC